MSKNLFPYPLKGMIEDPMDWRNAPEGCRLEPGWWMKLTGEGYGPRKKKAKKKAKKNK